MSRRVSNAGLHGNSFAAYRLTRAVSRRRAPIFLVLTFSFDQTGDSECRGMDTTFTSSSLKASEEEEQAKRSLPLWLDN